MPKEVPPPHNLQAEEGLLGAMLLSRAAITTASETLVPEDFYHPDHRVIFRAITDQVTEGLTTNPDPVTTAALLKDRGELDRIGGPPTLIHLQASTPATSNAPRYASIVMEESVRRAVATVLVESRSQVHEAETADKLVTGLNDQLRPLIARTNGRVHLATMTEALNDYLDVMEARELGLGLGLQFGLHDLDELTMGLRGGELWVGAGRPAMGKTILGVQVALQACVNGYQVLFISLEMNKRQLLDRMVSHHSGIPLTRLRNGKLTPEDQVKLAEAVGVLDGYPLTIMDNPAVTIEQVSSAARRLQDSRPVLVVLDYIQRMKAPNIRDGRQVEVSHVSNGCKTLALELDAMAAGGAVFGMAQINRGVESRDNKRPALSDLRDSGTLEQDADLVIGLYRDDYYREDSPDRGTVELIVLKARNGPTGTRRAAFLGHRAMFANMARTAGAGPRQIVDVEPGLDFSEPRDRELTA